MWRPSVRSFVRRQSRTVPYYAVRRAATSTHRTVVPYSQSVSFTHIHA